MRLAAGARMPIYVRRTALGLQAPSKGVAALIKERIADMVEEVTVSYDQ